MAEMGVLDEQSPALDAACRVLIMTGRPVTITTVAAEGGQDEATASAGLDRAESRGRLRRNEAGEIVAAAGISVVPSDYEVQVAGRRMWAWCAKTALGMLAALDAGGSVVARSPLTGVEVRVEFDGCRPVSTERAVFWPSDEFRSGCGSAADQYCPTFGLFENEAAALAWARAGDVPGEVIGVVEASERARPQYAASLHTTDQRERLVEALTRG